ncbi:hypothetical protein AAZX31_04G127600 [Glycine max]
MVSCGRKNSTFNKEVKDLLVMPFLFALHFNLDFCFSLFFIIGIEFVRCECLGKINMKTPERKFFSLPLEFIMVFFCSSWIRLPKWHA